MYHYIYKITNKINGNYYKGKHSTRNMNDGYLGSGVIISRAVKKYGRENFKIEIISYADDENSLNEMEKNYIAESDVSSDYCYNLSLGGQGGMIVLYYTHPKYLQTCEKIKKSAISRAADQSKITSEQHATARKTGTLTCMMGKTQSDKQKKAVSDALTGIKRGPETTKRRLKTMSEKRAMPGYVEPLAGKKLSAKHRAKISENHADVSGPKNPNYGKRKYFNAVTGESIRAPEGKQPTGWIESGDWMKMNRNKKK